MIQPQFAKASRQRCENLGLSLLVHSARARHGARGVAIAAARIHPESRIMHRIESIQHISDLSLTTSSGHRTTHRPRRRPRGGHGACKY
ncbi:hypothetical protein OH76DRAFT_817289 [Lentinus brumalis]|uniref:Uncharacterized protein n=1 Tax=Lentinus brumalis TaxID=2498619 RepID=A0A371D2K4_9APHY|nr:hypothetical protein OH76DRAFT_817289 [Polyporus brumalis]